MASCNGRDRLLSPMQLKHRWVEHGPEVLLALFASFGLMSIANAQVSRMEFEERD